ncbi:hypothetical protein PAXRUDRAFT_179950 [Paxillus rubicundulus Ve08.2h10]|uniref:Unplaced genomic scaffold scaffold_5634, whole genome shotgun sequence n=1 Tax=Paxillus rubicundulus Ve08.2h10 TaxID=930991 RepID=A0A0D0BM64_9AGAM|nr:hypothetical protein PAXRUDRAFT_179950 [Paxillus rubicundulus Ve08.2h10]
MSSTTPTTTTQLKIWQQNVNCSRLAQLELLDSPRATQWDIVALQEPYSNGLKNTTANSNFRTLYPTTCYTSNEKSHAITLISTSLETNSWTQILLPS